MQVTVTGQHSLTLARERVQHKHILVLPQQQEVILVRQRTIQNRGWLQEVPVVMPNQNRHQATAGHTGRVLHTTEVQAVGFLPEVIQLHLLRDQVALTEAVLLQEVPAAAIAAVQAVEVTAAADLPYHRVQEVREAVAEVQEAPVLHRVEEDNPLANSYRNI